MHRIVNIILIYIYIYIPSIRKEQRPVCAVSNLKYFAGTGTKMDRQRRKKFQSHILR